MLLGRLLRGKNKDFKDFKEFKNMEMEDNERFIALLYSTPILYHPTKSCPAASAHTNSSMYRSERSYYSSQENNDNSAMCIGVGAALWSYFYC
jgi:hypothetical protein